VSKYAIKWAVTEYSVQPRQAVAKRIFQFVMPVTLEGKQVLMLVHNCQF
jgi:hypothetical protein